MEDRNEIMNVNEEITDEAVVENKKSGTKMGAGLAVTVGIGLTLAAIAGAKKVKKLWDKRKKGKTEEDCDECVGTEDDVEVEE